MTQCGIYSLSLLCKHKSCWYIFTLKTVAFSLCFLFILHLLWKQQKNATLWWVYVLGRCVFHFVLNISSFWCRVYFLLTFCRSILCKKKFNICSFFCLCEKKNILWIFVSQHTCLMSKSTTLSKKCNETIITLSNARNSLWLFSWRLYVI